jgi:hypothetical protein
MKRIYPTLRLITLLTLLLGFATPAQAQSGTGGNLPPYLSMGTDGKIYLNSSTLTAGQPIFMQPEGVPSVQMTVGGQTICVGCLAFNSYTTPTGSTVVVPTAYTAIVMAITGKSPFTAQPDSYVANGILAAAMKAGVFEQMGISPDSVTPETILHTLQTMDPLMLIRLNATLNNPNNHLFEGQFFLAAGLFEFKCHPVTGQCPPVEPAPIPISDVYETICQSLGDCPNPPTDTCPRDWSVRQADPVYTAQQLAPPYPVVVGQDPNKTGVDYRAGVTVSPVIVKWNLEKRIKTGRDCNWHESTGHNGCDGEGADDHWGWDDHYETVCERQTRVFPDPVVSLYVNLQLDAASVHWIEAGDLQARYPGAMVYQADWPLWPYRPASETSISADQMSWLLTWKALQLADPGEWRTVVSGLTKGTPYTNPRQLSYNEITFKVAVIETALTK